MKRLQPAIAATEVLLVLPAALFMAALFVRNLQPQQYEPARTAQRIVDWYAASPHVGLAVLLIALPLLVLSTGATSLARAWKRSEELRESTKQVVSIVQVHFATFLVTLATLAAGGILAIVALHMLTD